MPNLDPELDGALAHLESLGFASFARTRGHELGSCKRWLARAQITGYEDVLFEDVTLPADPEELDVRIYRLPGPPQLKPLILFFRGGGWVWATSRPTTPSVGGCAGVSTRFCSASTIASPPRNPIPRCPRGLCPSDRVGVRPLWCAGCRRQASWNCWRQRRRQPRDKCRLDLLSHTDLAPRVLALIYPMLESSNPNAAGSQDSSWRRSFLSGEDIASFYRSYAPGCLDHVSLLPYARSALPRLPVTIVQAAEHDVLRPDSLRAVRQLSEVNVAVSFLPGEGSCTGFLASRASAEPREPRGNGFGPRSARPLSDKDARRASSNDGAVTGEGDQEER